MRILQVNTRHFLGGGDSTYAFALADLLASRDHQIAFFAMEDPRNIPDENSDLFAENIDYQKLNKSKSLSAGLRVLTRSIYSAEARKKFSMMIERFRPDLIHLHNIHAHITPSVIFESKKRGLPVVWTLHDYKLVCPNSHFVIDSTGQICEACVKGLKFQPVVRKCKKGSVLASAMAALEGSVHYLMRICEKVDAFVCPSIFMRGKMIAKGLPARRIHRVPYILDARNYTGSGTAQSYFLFSGRLEQIKGVNVLLEASRLVQHAKVVLAGRVDDQKREDLLSSLPANVSYVGLKTGKELTELISGALAVLVPSVWYENQPFSILEAFACRKPVIASNLGGMAELIGENERGLLVEPGDSDELAAAMRWIMNNGPIATRIGLAAREYVEKYHSPQQHYNSIMQVYDLVVSGKAT